MSPEELQREIQNLQPEPDWARRGVFLQEQPYEPVETLPPLRDPTQSAITTPQREGQIQNTLPSGYRLVRTIDQPDQVQYEVYKPSEAGGGVAARFHYVKDPHGVYRPYPASGIEIFDPKLRGQGLGQNVIENLLLPELKAIGSTGLSVEGGTSKAAQAMWQRLEAKGATVEDLPQTHPELGEKRAWVLREAAGQPKTPSSAEKLAPTPEAAGNEKWVSSIANRYVQARQQAGEIGEIAHGQGYSTQELINMGLKMKPQEVAQHLRDLRQGAGNTIRQAAAIRAEEARLSQRSAQASKIAEANPGNAQAKVQEENTYKELTDFHNNESAKLKNNWHGVGMAMQGEHEVDLTTYNGQRENWLRNSGGNPPPADVEPTLRQSARAAKKANDAAAAAQKKLSDEIGKPTRAKIPSEDDLRAEIAEKMGIGPCIVPGR
jgi:hypothetical protein